MTEGDIAVFITTSKDRDELYPERVTHQVKALGICDGYPAVCLQVGDAIEIHHQSQVKVITKDQIKLDPPC